MIFNTYKKKNEGPASIMSNYSSTDSKSRGGMKSPIHIEDGNDNENIENFGII